MLFSSALETSPIPVDLLGERLVVWRDSGGCARVMSDLCIHGGAPLSLGRVDGDQIICPYHGWRYASSGVCMAIPQPADPTRVPAKARIAAYQCIERYGIVWAALEEPRWPLPEAPQLESPDWRRVTLGPYTWHSDASRQIEIFTDFGHFAWVHPGLFGDPDHPVVANHTVRTEGHVLHYEYVPPSGRPPSSHVRGISCSEARPVTGPTRSRLFLAYTVVSSMAWGDNGGVSTALLFAPQPIGPDKCAGFFVMARTYGLEQPEKVDQETRDFEEVVFAQDQRIVEAQRPERVPFDLADELHLTFDAVAVAYRKAMRQQGLAYA